MGLLVISSLLSYWLGGLSKTTDTQSLLTENEQLNQQLDSVQKELTNVSQQLANVKIGADIDRQSVNEVRAVISDHEQTINELNEEISFYKGLMAPTERERGLGIRSWELYPGSAPNRYQFKLVMQQLALKHAVLKGSVKIDIVGKRAGVEEILPLSMLSDQVENTGVKLRFKYFQYADGELQLPIDFVPERIDIVAATTSPKKVQIEKHFSWLVQ
jgi:hypothetical protein